MEACAHTGQEQVAACGWILKHREKAASLFPGGTLVGWGKQTPAIAPGSSRRRRPWAGTGVLGSRAVSSWEWDRAGEGKRLS